MLSLESELTLENADGHVFAQGTIPAGPVGERREAVRFALDPGTGRIFRVTAYGICPDTVSAPAATVTEALALLREHPSSRAADVQPLAAEDDA